MEHQNIEIVNENSKVRNEAKTNMKAMIFYKKTRKKRHVVCYVPLNICLVCILTSQL